jgi:hypothetical protein
MASPILVTGAASIYGQGFEEIRRNGRLEYLSFDKDGKPTDEAAMKKCFPCHEALKDRDFVLTRYAP